MRKLILYIACSMDGFIADEQGRVDWLNEIDICESGDWYAKFYDHIDTVLLGRHTFDQIIELSPNVWPYEEKTTYVFTHHPLEDQKNLHFLQQDPSTCIQKWKQQEGKDIWLNGGAHLIKELWQDIDELHSTTIPATIGKGIRLYPQNQGFQRFQLMTHKAYGSMILSIYKKR